MKVAAGCHQVALPHFPLLPGRGILLSIFASFLVAHAAERVVLDPKDKADHWAFKIAPRPPIPEPKGGIGSRPRNPIDHFILARLDSEKLWPSREAEHVTLIRRVTFDLTGLPPTPDEVKEFVSDHRPDAYERLVERLLASPRYGERWARHWLDVVHFGESHGYDKDKPRTNAWPYRDYVIKSFNDEASARNAVN